MSARLAGTLLLTYFHYFMSYDFNHSLIPVLDRIESLTLVADPELADKLIRTGVGYFFAVPWILTWFTHSIRNFDSLCVLINSLIRESPLTVNEWMVQISVAALILNRDNIMREGNDVGRVFKEAQNSPDVIPIRSILEYAHRIRDTFPNAESKTRIDPRRSFLTVGFKWILISIFIAICYQLTLNL
jgi:hypothetical protein